MGKNTEEIKARQNLYKKYIDRGVEPENLNDDRDLYVCYFITKTEESVKGKEAKNIKEAAKLVQEFVDKVDVDKRIVVREKHKHVRLLDLELKEDGSWWFHETRDW